MFFGVIDFTALSFPGLSMGEIPPKAEECSGGKESPMVKSEEKTSPLGFTELLKGSMKSTGLKPQTEKI